MRVDHVVYIAEQAVRQWERNHCARAAAEDAWFILFSLRTRADLLPSTVREEFLDLWTAYGDLPPSRVTKQTMTEFLDGLCDQDFLRIERKTRAFLTSTRLLVTGLLA